MATARGRWVLVAVAAVAFAGCGSEGGGPTDPGIGDPGADVAADPGQPDLGTDEGEEPGRDAEPDGLADTATDAEPDPGADAPPPSDANPDTPGVPTNLCRPCISDSECQTDVDPDAACVSWGNEGSFCGIACSDARPCPEGYDCVIPRGLATGQCRPADGEKCPCLPEFAGARTVCYAENGLGRCPAMRTCDEACGAPLPTAETCNGLDDDCNGQTDELLGETTCGLGVCSHTVVNCVAGKPVDCDPVEGRLTETCNGLDDDCDGETDEAGAAGCQTFFLDGDNDGSGLAGDTLCLCQATAPYAATLGGDCDDGDPLAYPGAAETCNGKDDDCDGLTDEPGAAGCESHFADRDADGYGAGLALCVCGLVPPYTADVDGDCDDLDAARNPSVLEVCNGVDDDCDGIKDDVAPTACQNKNGFGTCQGTAACSLGKPVCKGPIPAAEVCGNAKDDDCDGDTDESWAAGCIPHYRDDDADGWGKAGDSRCLCGPAKPYLATKPGDCNDKDADIHPENPESCDGKDNDCDGGTDPADSAGCQLFWADRDLDGFGTGDPSCLCAATGVLKAQASGDCDDQDGAIHPGVAEVCNGRDDDCDGTTDPAGAQGCHSYWTDADGDGFGVGDAACLCLPDGDLRARQAGDCDDTLDFANPSAPEKCGNGVDDDCDGTTDEPGCVGCINYWNDPDGDGYGTGDPACLGGPDATHTATKGGDCDENEVKVNPGMPELCGNLVDDDCNGIVDEPGAKGCHILYPDADGDGYGAKGKSLCMCGVTGDYKVTVGGDCDDTNPAVHPGQPESCNDLDDDCNGVVDDPGAAGCGYLLRDGDGDGFGVAGDQRCVCKATPPYSASQAGDCDDASAAVHPGALEVCDGIDDNCDGVVDPVGTSGCADRWLDGDNDGYGIGSPQCVCAGQRPWTATGAGDCNDGDSAVYPGQAEACNGMDDDCNGLVDESGALGCTPVWRDQDGDGYGDPATEACLCAVMPGWVTNEADCNDGAPGAHPGGAEKCDGLDNDCDGLTDEEDSQGCATYLKDADGDGWGVPLQTKCLCGPTAPYTSQQGPDCDDTRATVHPGAGEVCNGLDDDCNGIVDDPGTTGCQDRWLDMDQDGYGSTIDTPVCLCAGVGSRTALQGGDCDDGAKAINPGKAEVCANHLDDNCNGAIDEGCR